MPQTKARSLDDILTLIATAAVARILGDILHLDLGLGTTACLSGATNLADPAPPLKPIARSLAWIACGAIGGIVLIVALGQADSGLSKVSLILRNIRPHPHHLIADGNFSPSFCVI
jgi:hypothetical protein